jgi:hypothetical protein
MYSKNISLNPSKIAGDFIDFTVLISITDSDLKNKAQIDGDDILFMDDVGVAHRLWHEIEYYDSTSGELICWVQLPQVLSSDENKFVMYYGNLVASNQQFPSQTWNDQYMGVWHLNDNPLNQIKDSTYNNNDGTAYGSMTSVNQALGKTGMALDFDGIDDYISVPDSPSLQPKDVTLSFWYKALSSDVGGYIVSKGSFDYWGNSDGHTYGFRNAETIRAVFEKDTNEQYEQIGSHIPVIEQWQHLLLSYDESTLTGSMFVDGVMIGEQTNCHSTVLWYYKPWDLLMGASKQGTGAGKTPTHFRNCILDEIRILDSALSPDWVQTEYYNQNDPVSFYTIGPEETGS